MYNLFETPIREKEVRKNIIAYQYRNGTININGQKYCMYSMSEAIRQFRKNFPANKKH